MAGLHGRSESQRGRKEDKEAQTYIKRNAGLVQKRKSICDCVRQLGFLGNRRKGMSADDYHVLY